MMTDKPDGTKPAEPEPKKPRPFRERFPDIEIAKEDGGAISVIGGVRIPPKPADPERPKLQPWAAAAVPPASRTQL